MKIKITSVIITLILVFTLTAAQAFVTFYNNNDASLIITYKLCNPDASMCSAVSTTPTINPNSVYKDVNIVLSDDPTDQKSYYFFVATSVKVILSDGSSYIKNIPSVGDVNLTPCNSNNDGGDLFKVFPKEDDLFCVSGTG